MGKLTERRERILKILENKQLTTVTDLSEELNVTTETIRKDLLQLENSGKIVRIHGGAALSNSSQELIPYNIRQNLNSERKQKVAACAADLIRKGEIVLLESSTTTAALCQELLKKPELLKTLTIITNSFYIVQCLKMGELCSRVFFLGGWMSTTESATYGSSTVEMLNAIRVNKAFLSGAAMNRKLELTTYFERDMLFQQAAIKYADETVLMLDSGKYPATGALTVAPMSDFRYFVTDIRFSREKKNLFKEWEVRLFEV